MYCPTIRTALSTVSTSAKWSHLLHSNRSISRSRTASCALPTDSTLNSYALLSRYYATHEKTPRDIQLQRNSPVVCFNAPGFPREATLASAHRPTACGTHDAKVCCVSKRPPEPFPSVSNPQLQNIRRRIHWTTAPVFDLGLASPSCPPPCEVALAQCQHEHPYAGPAAAPQLTSKTATSTVIQQLSIVPARDGA